MDGLDSFVKAIASLGLKQVDLAIAFMWYFDRTGDESEFSPGSIAEIIHEQGFAKPNVSRLRTQLAAHRQTIKGKITNTFKISIAARNALNGEYEKFVTAPQKHEIRFSIIPKECLSNTRGYLEKLAEQINGSYELGYYDCCAVMMRRLMESLVIEVYASQGREQEIKINNEFCGLETLIDKICSDNKVHLARGMK